MDEIDRRIKALEAAEKVFCWYYIFGEDNLAARDLLADLGNRLRACGYLNLSNQGLQTDICPICLDEKPIDDLHRNCGK
ncbi:MAG TPA: hypothetical protein VMV56_08845 [Williamwhitmania sp.]|nr:hypothetical protein [Williamwhitmania sp.]